MLIIVGIVEANTLLVMIVLPVRNQTGNDLYVPQQYSIDLRASLMKKM